MPPKLSRINETWKLSMSFKNEFETLWRRLSRRTGLFLIHLRTFMLFRTEVIRYTEAINRNTIIILYHGISYHILCRICLIRMSIILHLSEKTHEFRHYLFSVRKDALWHSINIWSGTRVNGAMRHDVECRWWIASVFKSRIQFLTVLDGFACKNNALFNRFYGLWWTSFDFKICMLA